MVFWPRSCRPGWPFASRADSGSDSNHPPKPACDEPPTRSDQEGPYFTLITRTGLIPRVRYIRDGARAEWLRLFDRMHTNRKRQTRFLASRRCRCLRSAGVWVRGHQFTDADGLYRLETVVPGRYEPRPPHIHVRVEADGFPALVSQLYLDDGGSGADPDRRLLVPESQSDGSVTANFTSFSRLSDQSCFRSRVRVVRVDSVLSGQGEWASTTRFFAALRMTTMPRPEWPHCCARMAPAEMMFQTLALAWVTAVMLRESGLRHEILRCAQNDNDAAPRMTSIASHRTTPAEMMFQTLASAWATAVMLRKGSAARDSSLRSE